MSLTSLMKKLVLRASGTAQEFLSGVSLFLRAAQEFCSSAEGWPGVSLVGKRGPGNEASAGTWIGEICWIDRAAL